MLVKAPEQVRGHVAQRMCLPRHGESFALDLWTQDHQGGRRATVTVEDATFFFSLSHSLGDEVCVTRTEANSLSVPTRRVVGRRGDTHSHAPQGHMVARHDSLNTTRAVLCRAVSCRAVSCRAVSCLLPLASCHFGSSHIGSRLKIFCQLLKLFGHRPEQDVKRLPWLLTSLSRKTCHAKRGPIRVLEEHHLRIA